MGSHKVKDCFCVTIGLTWIYSTKIWLSFLFMESPHCTSLCFFSKITPDTGYLAGACLCLSYPISCFSLDYNIPGVTRCKQT